MVAITPGFDRDGCLTIGGFQCIVFGPAEFTADWFHLDVEDEVWRHQLAPVVRRPDVDGNDISSSLC